MGMVPCEVLKTKTSAMQFPTSYPGSFSYEVVQFQAVCLKILISLRLVHTCIKIEVFLHLMYVNDCPHKPKYDTNIRLLGKGIPLHIVPGYLKGRIAADILSIFASCHGILQSL